VTSSETPRLFDPLNTPLINKFLPLQVQNTASCQKLSNYQHAANVNGSARTY